MKIYSVIVPLLLAVGCQQAMDVDPNAEKVASEVFKPEKAKGHDWLVLNTGSETLAPSRLKDVFFWSDDRGVAIGTSGVFLTLDGGLSWKRLAIDKEVTVGAEPVEVSWTSVRMTSPDDIYAFGYSGSGTAKQLFLYKSSNLGRNWVRSYYSRLKYRDRVTLATKVLKQFGEQRLLSLADDGQMKVADTIIDDLAQAHRIETCGLESMVLLGGMGQSFLSTDNAKTWNQIQWSDEFIPTDVSFPGDVSFGGQTVGYAVGSGFTGGVVLKTDDGGRNWKELTIPSEIGALNSCHFITSIKGFIAGDEGAVYYTNDGGQTWSDCSLFTGDTVSDVVFGQNGIGWVSISGKNNPGHGSVYFTRDFGKTWGSELSGYKYISRLYSDRPGKIVGVGHVPNSNSDLIVIYESAPNKKFIKARSEMKDIEDITPVVPELVEPEVLKPIVKPVKVVEPVEFEIKEPEIKTQEPAEDAQKETEPDLKPEKAATESKSPEDSVSPEQIPEGAEVISEATGWDKTKRFFRRLLMLESDPDFSEQ